MTSIDERCSGSAVSQQSALKQAVMANKQVQIPRRNDDTNVNHDEYVHVRE